MSHTALTSTASIHTSRSQGEYKKLILERLIKGIKVDSSSMIVQSIQKVDQEKAKRCCHRRLNRIRT
jgi:hypothetical protein